VRFITVDIAVFITRQFESLWSVPSMVRVEIKTSSVAVCDQRCSEQKLCVPSMKFVGKSWRLKESAERLAKGRQTA